MKAAGKNGLRNKAWLLVDINTTERLRKILQRINDQEKIPKRWNEDWICPIFKKEETKQKNIEE